MSAPNLLEKREKFGRRTLRHFMALRRFSGISRLTFNNCKHVKIVTTTTTPRVIPMTFHLNRSLKIKNVKFTEMMRNMLQTLLHIVETIATFLLAIWIWSGAKKYKLWRSRKTLNNEDVVAKIGGCSPEIWPGGLPIHTTPHTLQVRVPFHVSGMNPDLKKPRLFPVGFCQSLDRSLGICQKQLDPRRFHQQTLHNPNCLTHGLDKAAESEKLHPSSGGWYLLRMRQIWKELPPASAQD